MAQRKPRACARVLVSFLLASTALFWLTNEKTSVAVRLKTRNVSDCRDLRSREGVSWAGLSCSPDVCVFCRKVDKNVPRHWEGTLPSSVVAYTAGAGCSYVGRGGTSSSGWQLAACLRGLSCVKRLSCLFAPPSFSPRVGAISRHSSVPPHPTLPRPSLGVVLLGFRAP